MARRCGPYGCPTAGWWRGAMGIDWYSPSSGGGQIAAPFVINALPRSTTSIFIYFNTSGADSYVLQRATDAGFSAGLTTVSGYNGTSLTFTDTGLSAGTLYYYRVKAVKSGYTDSAFSSTSCSTHAFTPVGLYSMEGGEQNVTNSYFTFTGSLVTTIKNASGGAGANFDASTGNLTYDVVTNKRASVVGRIGAAAYTSSGNVTLSGDCCIAMYVEHDNAAAVCPILSDSPGDTSYFGINTAKTFLQTRVNSTNYDLPFGATVPNNRLSKIVYKREGNQARASLDGGYTYGNAVTVSTANIVINRFFAQANNGNRSITSWLMFAFFDDVLTGDQLAPFFEPYKQSDYTKTDPGAYTPQFTGSWRDLTNGSPLDAGVSVQDNGSFAWRRAWSVGNYAFIKSTKDATLYNSEQLLSIYNYATGKVSTAKVLPAYTSSTDIHDQSSILAYDKTIFQVGHDKNYANNNNTFRFREFGQNFDLRQYTEKQVDGGVTNQLARSNMYTQATVVGNTVACLMQKFLTQADGMKIMYSTDRMNSWTLVQPFTTTLGTWPYPILLNNGTLNKFSFIIVENTQSTAKYPSISYLETTDFSTFTDITGGYSYTVNPNSLVNLTTIITNAAMRTTTGNTIKNIPPGNFMETSTGFVYGIHGDGENTGWEVTYYSSGWQHKAVSFPAAQNVVLPPAGAGTNFNRVSPIVLNTGTNTYEIYALCDPSSDGNYRVGKFTTSDTFATQMTFVSYVSTDNTRKHWNLQVDFNYHFNAHAVLVGTQVDGSNGYEWIYPIK